MRPCETFCPPFTLATPSRGPRRLLRLPFRPGRFIHLRSRSLGSGADSFPCFLIPTAYVYRLCLEYARLWSDDRDGMSYSG